MKKKLVIASELKIDYLSLDKIIENDRKEIILACLQGAGKEYIRECGEFAFLFKNAKYKQEKLQVEYSKLKK